MEESAENPSNGNKKAPLEELDRVELIKRCKNYLVLAQRAKVAKDDAVQRENEHIEKISHLEKRIKKFNDEKSFSAKILEDVQNEKSLLSTQLADITSNLKLKEEESNSLIQQIDTLQASLKTLEDNFTQQKDGFVEELNKMNIVLKQRGETITRLEERLQSSEKEFKANVETVLQSVADRERKIEQLESEVNRLETQSEMMSTSTVSKAEEIHRMRDVDDSLEERYNKLKMLAVRMKRKISEMNGQLQEKDNQLSAADDRGNSGRNLQAFQKDIDRLNDELDSKKSEISVLKKDFENAIQELGLSKQRAEEFKDEASLLRTSLANVEKSKKILEKSVQELKVQFDENKREHESDKILRLEQSKQCDRLREEIRQLHSTIDELTRSNHSAKQESKKQTLLELELTDYEKSLGELNLQLDSARKELTEKQKIADRFSEEKGALQAQIQFLEQQVSTEQQRANDSKMALDAIQTQLETSRAEAAQQKIEIRQFTAKAESKESEVEILRLQLSNVNGELHKAKTAHSLQVETLRKQVIALDEALRAEKTTKDSLQAELLELQSEYENYKVRATSVLKKQKNEVQTTAAEPSGEFNTDQVEREMLQRVVEALKSKISELESQLSLSQSEVSNLRSERDRIAVAQVANAQALQQRIDRAEVEMEIVRRDHQALIARLQADNQLLASLHREQVDGMKVRHTQELLDLQNQLDESNSDVIKLEKALAASQALRNSSPPIKGDPRRDDLVIMERERGEGSEDGSIYRRHREGSVSEPRSPMPLEALLNSSQIFHETEIHSPVPPDSVSVQQYKESMLALEKRCGHLAALLAESEANEARFSQLADALKEEIRRTERSEERQKHIENLEYLKNVVLKFITLPRGEERSRLVPVLTTLLRLSPAEVEEVHLTFSRLEGAARPMAWGGVFNYFAPTQ